MKTITEKLYKSNGDCYDLKKGIIYDYDLSHIIPKDGKFTFDKIKIGRGKIKVNKHFLFISKTDIKVTRNMDNLLKIVKISEEFDEHGYVKQSYMCLYRRKEPSIPRFNLGDMKWN